VQRGRPPEPTATLAHQYALAKSIDATTLATGRDLFPRRVGSAMDAVPPWYSPAKTPETAMQAAIVTKA
jgi:hypothetical protein